MKICLFDQILERHVGDALHRGLVQQGHEVVATGKVWRGHLFPESKQQIKKTDEILEEICAAGFDALINLRATSLLPEQVKRLRSAHIQTTVWFPDDPVLYGLCYSHITDCYDLTLHCGPRKVLEFYDKNGHKKGVNFPFWVDPDVYQYGYDLSKAEQDVVFLGNMEGQVRERRYEMLRPFAGRLDVWGKASDDPARMHRGWLDGTEAVVRQLGKYRAAISVSQEFQDYRGSRYDFPELKHLGNFFLPSRVIQYAAVGLPVFHLGDDIGMIHFPWARPVEESEELGRLLDEALADEDVLNRLSHHGRDEIERSFSGHTRARFLDAMLSGRLSPSLLTLHDREFAYRWFGSS